MLRDPRTENRSSNTATARCGGYSRDRIRKHLTLAMLRWFMMGPLKERSYLTPIEEHDRAVYLSSRMSSNIGSDLFRYLGLHTIVHRIIKIREKMSWLSLVETISLLFNTDKIIE